jgi:hypothetical protein
MADDKKKSFPIKNIALWTGWYFVASYLIFLFVFHFNILHGADWVRIPRIALSGLPGAAFGLALLSWVPIWFAGCATIKKTGKPLFALPQKEPPNKDAASAEKTAEKEPEIKFPNGMPEEMRVPYARMVRGQLSRGALDCKVVQNPCPATALSAECAPESAESLEDMAAMPLPDDFDFSAADSSDTPVFKELSWGSNDTDLDTDLDTESDTDTLSNSDHQLTIKIETIGGKKFAIATHDDADFWVADGKEWFATGKQKQSPIEAAIAAAAENDATPVLHLVAENIMDLGELREKWRTAGVLVVKDLSELLSH